MTTLLDLSDALLANWHPVVVTALMVFLILTLPWR
jgi:hypothetical protein